MITTDRNVGIMAHLTKETKERFRLECARRKIGMSEQLSMIIEEWLIISPNEQLKQKRSNKRDIDPLKDVPLPLE